jgi:hypothetical protein
MKKDILKLGKNLKKEELKTVFGGNPGGLNPPPQCGGSAWLEPFGETGCLLFDHIWYCTGDPEVCRCWSCA